MRGDVSVHVAFSADNVVGNLVHYLLGMSKIVDALNMFIGSVQVPGNLFCPVAAWMLVWCR